MLAVSEYGVWPGLLGPEMTGTEPNIEMSWKLFLCNILLVNNSLCDDLL